MRRLTLTLAALLGACALAAAADKTGRKLDAFWTAPDLQAVAPPSIALLPVATYDANVDARRMTEAAVGQALRGSGHRWISGLAARELLVRAGGDSLLKAVNDRLVKAGRLDSLQAPFVSNAVRARGLLCVRVEEFSQYQPEFNQSGFPSTTVKLRAALMDSTGRLLWTASGSETAEGPYHDASLSAISVKNTGLGNQPVTGQGGPPTYQETLGKILARWAESFPTAPKPPQPD